MAQLPIPCVNSEIALERGRAQVERCFKVCAEQRIVADVRNLLMRAGQIGVLADGVVGGAQAGLGNNAPTAGVDWYGDVRVEIEPAHIARKEAWLRAVQVTQ